MIESTRVRRFHITEKGKKAFPKCDSLISTKFLTKISKEYCRLVEEADIKDDLQPKIAPAQCKDGIVALIDMLGTKEHRSANCTMRMHHNWHTLLLYTKKLTGN